MVNNRAGKIVVFYEVLRHVIIAFCLAGLQSTPIKAPASLLARTDMLNELHANLPQISPIATHPQQLANINSSNSNSKFHTFVRPKARIAVPAVPSFDADADIEEADEILGPITIRTMNTTNPTARNHRHQTTTAVAAANAQRDFDERQSLTNFEEFEKSLSMCQTDHDFDDMLNGLAGNAAQQQRRSTDAQMRQSLDHIKKRHSLLNLEKQLEDQQRRHANATGVVGVVVAPAAPAVATMNVSSDSNRCLQSSAHSQASTSMLLSTSGSGERLLRRSRVTDEYSSPSRGGGQYQTAAPPTQAMLMMLSSSSTTSSMSSDSKENVHSNNNDSNRNERDTLNGPTITTIAGGTEADAVAMDSQSLQLKPRSIPNNRDRFKTIRISKRVSNHEAHVPHITADHSGTEPSDVDENCVAAECNADVSGPRHGDTNRGNVMAPQSMMPPPAAVPRRRLTRPSQLSGLTIRRDASLTLTRPERSANVSAHADGGTAAQQQQRQITSPMGTKAKSIHNLVDRASAEKSADETNARSQKEVG